MSVCPAEQTGWIENLLRGQKCQSVFWGRGRVRFIITSCHLISSSCWPSLCWQLVWQGALQCCRLLTALPLWPWGLYLFESKGLFCIGEMCCQLAEVNAGGFYFGISTESDKVWCRWKDYWPSSGHPIQFSNDWCEFAFIHSPSLLVGPKRIRDKNRSMCKCLLWSIYQGVMVFGTWQRCITLPPFSKTKIRRQPSYQGPTMHVETFSLF